MKNNKSNSQSGNNNNKRMNKQNWNKRKGRNQGREKVKKELKDHYYYTGSSRQASDYESTTDFIINHIKGNFAEGQDIAESLKNMQYEDTEKWYPTLKKSNATDKDIQEAENEGLKMRYKALLDAAVKRIRTYETNKIKAYSLLWERCSKSMKSQLQQRKEFEKKVYNNPIELLKAIKQHALNYQESLYVMEIIDDALINFLLTKQKDEPLYEYVRRFKTAKEVVESHLGGPIEFSKYIKNNKKYDEDDKTIINELRDEAWEEFAAYKLLKNANPQKYGQVIRHLKDRKSIGKDEFPKTLTLAINTLSTQNYEKERNNNDNYNKNKNKERNYQKDDKNEQDEKTDNPTYTFATMEYRCYCCGEKGHKSPQCPLKDKIPKADWAFNKATINFMKTQQEKSNDTTIRGVTEQDKNGWAATQIKTSISNDMRNKVLLDSGATTSIFCNPKYCKEIKDSNIPIKIQTNSGNMIATRSCHIPELGEAYYNGKGMTNIIGLSQMRKKYRVTYDSQKEPAFHIHMKNKLIKFPETEDGLYAIDMDEKANNTNENEKSMVITTKDIDHLYTKKQKMRALRAKDLHHALGSPSTYDLKAIITQNLIQDNPITIEDVDLATQIFGADIGCLKGKSTRKKPIIARNNMIELPSELQNRTFKVIMYIDIITINTCKFITTITSELNYRTIHYIKTSNTKEIIKGITEAMTLYKNTPFIITEIHCDNEFKKSIASLKNNLDQNITPNFCNPQEHVPTAERNNRTIKDRCRSVYYNLPYKRITKLMVIYLALSTTAKLNYFPSKQGLSKYYSPRMLLHRRNLEFKKHCQFSFGAYIQAYNENNPMNTMKERAIDCIYLRPTTSWQGGHELLHIKTNKIIIRKNITELPITQNIINQIEQTAAEENMPIHFNSKLNDNIWLAGVDNDNDNEIIQEHNVIDDIQEEENDIEKEMIEEINTYKPYQTKNYPTNNVAQNESNNNHIEEYEYDEDNEINEDQNELELHEQQEISEENTDMYVNDEENIPETESKDDEMIHTSPQQTDITEDTTEDIRYDFDDLSFNELINLEEIDQDTDNEIDEENSVNELTNEEKYKKTLKDMKESRINWYTKSGRAIKTPHKYVNWAIPVKSGLQKEEYGNEMAQVIGRVMCHLQQKTKEEWNLSSKHYSLKQGIKKFGNNAKNAAMKEMSQLHNRKVFTPIKLEEMNKREKARAMESLIFLVQKQDGSIKARACANGSTQREYTARDDATSPTVSTEAVLITGVIEAKQKRDIMTADIPNAFVQTEIPQEEGKDRITMKIKGALIDILTELCPETYKDYIAMEKGERVLYVMMQKALYGMLVSAVLFYKKLRKDLEGIGFKINPYDTCVANRIVKGTQHTVVWHVDDLKSSHMMSSVNDEFIAWLKETYAKDGIGEIKFKRGKIHPYLGMSLDYTVAGKLKVDMRDYIKSMMKDFPSKITGKAKTPWTEGLYKENHKMKDLEGVYKEIFHTYVMKLMFLSKRGRPDILTGVAYLTTRVRKPNLLDWKKLTKILSFLQNTIEKVLTLEADNDQIIRWHVDASYASHDDMKSHTGACVSIGKGMISSYSRKQKVNTRSSTEAELIGIDDMISKIIWFKNFIEAQGFHINRNIVFQDNQSAIKLEENGKESNGKRTKHFNVKLFYVTDLIKRKEMEVSYCPSEEMTADLLTKPVIGNIFERFSKEIMNE